VKTLFVAVRAALYAAGFILLWAWLAGVVRRYDVSRLAPGWAPVGMVLAACGAVIVLACLGTFVIRGRGTAFPLDPPVVFVPTGPYRYVRNPMYIGAALVLAGYGLFVGSVSVLLLSLAFLIVMHLFVILGEEAGLERRFGESYLAYKRAVNRWVPRVPRPS
jgi:protein-S-isoprenylcysteine O-methyltransferase Ste14